ncbi:MAG TPA: cell division protein FtsL [Candidatus Binataceae bacterium]|nr:cell division protein FtsL [Candidatus Binataceae bacterium]
MNRRLKPAEKPSRFMVTVLVAIAIALGFATLMVRLEVVEEGYRLSSLSQEVAELQEKNRSLKLEVAQLSSRERLRMLAAKYRMTAPARGQVVVVP